MAHGRAGGQPQAAQSYGKASIILSIIGIVLGIIFIIFIIVYFVVFASVATSKAIDAIDVSKSYSDRTHPLFQKVNPFYHYDNFGKCRPVFVSFYHSIQK